jgi:hypothetical protein
MVVRDRGCANGVAHRSIAVQTMTSLTGVNVIQVCCLSGPYMARC